MGTTLYAGWTYPDRADADNVPVDVKSVYEQVETRTVLRCLDAAERDARFDTVPDGTPVTSTVDGTLWVKAGGTWRTVWAPTTEWMDVPLASGISGTLHIRVATIGDKRQASLRGQIQRDNGADFTDEQMAGGRLATLATEHRPSSTGTNVHLPAGTSVAGDSFVPVVRVDIAPNTGDLLLFGAQHSDGTGWQNVGWVSLFGSQYWID